MGAEIALDSVQETIRITCGEAGCVGCNWVHRRPHGEPRYYVDGELATRAVYLEECARVGSLPASIEEVSGG